MGARLRYNMVGFCLLLLFVAKIKSSISIFKTNIAVLKISTAIYKIIITKIKNSIVLIETIFVAHTIIIVKTKKIFAVFETFVVILKTNSIIVFYHIRNVSSFKVGVAEVSTI